MLRKHKETKLNLWTFLYNIQSVSMKYLHALCLSKQKETYVCSPKVKGERERGFQISRVLGLLSGDGNQRQSSQQVFSLDFFFLFSGCIAILFNRSSCFSYCWNSCCVLRVTFFQFLFLYILKICQFLFQRCFFFFLGRIEEERTLRLLSRLLYKAYDNQTQLWNLKKISITIEYKFYK